MCAILTHRPGAGGGDRHLPAAVPAPRQLGQLQQGVSQGKHCVSTREHVPHRWLTVCLIVRDSRVCVLGLMLQAVGKGMGRPVFRVIQTHFAAAGNVGAVAAKEEVWEVHACVCMLGSEGGFTAAFAALPGTNTARTQHSQCSTPTEGARASALHVCDTVAACLRPPHRCLRSSPATCCPCWC
jgi:hypothetical protein